jgi:Leucine-rich repeat (LRR) protein
MLSREIKETDIINGHIKKEIVDGLVKDRIRRLDVSNNHLIKHVPKLEYLEYLIISNCPKIKQLPNLKKLKILICHESGLRKLPRLTNLEVLNCSRTFIKQIPSNLTSLKSLECNGCRRLEIIPELDTLEYLDCLLCNKLKRVPYLKNLNELNCSNSKLNTIGIKSIDDYKEWIKKVDKYVSMLKSGKLPKDLLIHAYKNY